MAVRAIFCRKHPLRRATLTQFRVTKASTKGGALKHLGWAAHAWDGKPSLCALERQRPLTLPAPSNRSHTYARGCARSWAPMNPQCTILQPIVAEHLAPKNAVAAGSGLKARALCP